MSEMAPIEEELVAQWFENSYECSRCGTEWSDEWVLHVQRQVSKLQCRD